MHLRPTYLDLLPAALPAACSRWDVIEPKLDGRFAVVTVSAGRATLVSRHGVELRTLDAAAGVDAVLLAEEFVGTERAKGSADHGRVFVFDCAARDGRDLRGRPLAERRAAASEVVAALADPRFALVPQWPSAEAEARWAEVVVRGGGEGLVFKSSSANLYGAEWGRLKPRLTVDLVVEDVVLGSDGLPSSLVCGGVKVRLLQDVVRYEVASLGRRVVGRVVEVVAMEATASGSLRHARFMRWRDDKVVPRPSRRPARPVRVRVEGCASHDWMCLDVGPLHWYLCRRCNTVVHHRDDVRENWRRDGDAWTNTKTGAVSRGAVAPWRAVVLSVADQVQPWIVQCLAP